MAFGTGIDYADATFSPWIGCTKVSPGCANCYAEGVGKRMGIEWGPDKPRRFMPDSYWEQPRVWNRKAKKLGKRYRVFVSLCDPFEHDEQHPDCERTENEIVRLCHMIEQTPSLDWLLLTKRPANIPASVPVGWYRDGFPINLWLGVTCEDQQRADERIPLLLQVRAAVRWLSLEPQLELVVPDLDGIDWLVIGCESGPRARPRARPFNQDWAQSVVDQCKAAGVPCFTKQLRKLDGTMLKSAKLEELGWPVQYPEPRP